MVRYEIMKRFGYYVHRVFSEHNAEYMPYFIKDKYPELIERFNIPLDEYPRRCVNQIEDWTQMRKDLVEKHDLTHERSKEYASHIMEAMETNQPYKIGGNVLNTRADPQPARRTPAWKCPAWSISHGVQPVLRRQPARAVRRDEPHQHQRAAPDHRGCA